MFHLQMMNIEREVSEKERESERARKREREMGWGGRLSRTVKRDVPVGGDQPKEGPHTDHFEISPVQTSACLHSVTES